MLYNLKNYVDLTRLISTHYSNAEMCLLFIWIPICRTMVFVILSFKKKPKEKQVDAFNEIVQGI